MNEDATKVGGAMKLADALAGGNGGCPFEVGDERPPVPPGEPAPLQHGPGVEDRKARGRFLREQRRKKDDVARREREQAEMNLAALAAASVKKELPECLHPFVSCAVSGKNATMHVHIRLKGHPAVFCPLEPVWPPAGQGDWTNLPSGYRLPKRPGRHWRVGDLDLAVEDLDEALALAEENMREEFEERWEGRRGDSPFPQDGRSFVGDMVLTSLTAYIVQAVEEQVELRVDEAVDERLKSLGVIPAA